MGDAVLDAGGVAVGDGVVGAGGVAVGDAVVGAGTGTVGAAVAILVGDSVAAAMVGARVGDTVGRGAGAAHCPLSTQHSVQQGHTTSSQSALSSSIGVSRLQSPMGMSPTRSTRPTFTVFNEEISPS